MKRNSVLALLLCCALAMTSCAGAAQSAPVPTPESTQTQRVQWPREKLTTSEDGVPMLDVYVTDEKAVRRMDLETYVQGVLAGEMKNDWPMEALKAQAILARTFVLKFIEEKDSRYPGADISTDIEEAQAYDAFAVNERIRQAVAETRGLVLASGGALPYAWFHAHSGGMTDLAEAGLGWDREEPAYTHSVSGNEPTNAEDMQSLRDAQSWVASFPYEEIESAMRKLGKEVELTEDSAFEVGRRTQSGRAHTLLIAGAEIGAAQLRIALGSTKMRSTLLSTFKAEKGTVTMAGKGYGHGVGMSQWGAYGMAQAGRKAEEIVRHYFRNITLEKLW